MTAHDFHSDSDEWKIFLVALQSFSDACVPPELTPGCPFYQKGEHGVTCGEQCMDLIAKYRDDFPRRPAFDLGDGIEVIPRPRRRARRDPEPTVRPFDAKYYRSRDRDKPTDTKHTVSLVNELTELLTVPPHLADDSEERRYLVLAILDQLAERGFDSEDLRLIVVKRISIIMAAWVVVSKVADVAGLADEDRELFALPESWSGLTESITFFFDPETQAIVNVTDPEGLLTAIMPAVVSWNLEQDIVTIVEWETLPSVDYIKAHATDHYSESGTFQKADWLVDRFTKTYLTEWKTASLDLEWKYLHGQEMGCGAPGQMQLRRVKQGDVALEIANRAVGDRSSGKTGKRRVRAEDFTETAISLLTAKRYDSAVAMFEALRRIEPGEPALANNLAFCLMPTHPERSLALLEEAAQLAGHMPPLSWANKIATLYLLRRDDDLIAELKGGFPSVSDSAWLWVINDRREIKHLAADVPISDYVEQFRLRVVES